MPPLSQNLVSQILGYWNAGKSYKGVTRRGRPLGAVGEEWRRRYIYLLRASTSTLPCPGNKVAVLLTADQLMIARDPHFNLSELTRCLQPSPAQPSPAQPSPDSNHCTNNTSHCGHVTPPSVLSSRAGYQWHTYHGHHVQVCIQRQPPATPLTCVVSDSLMWWRPDRQRKRCSVSCGHYSVCTVVTNSRCPPHPVLVPSL